MKERWIVPRPIKESERDSKRRDMIFSAFLTVALLAMLGVTYYAKRLLKVPVLLCFLILAATSFIAFIKDKPSTNPTTSWLTTLRKLLKVIIVSLVWILLLNKLL